MGSTQHLRYWNAKKKPWNEDRLTEMKGLEGQIYGFAELEHVDRVFHRL
jgi:hypothetical protein